MNESYINRVANEVVNTADSIIYADAVSTLLGVNGDGQFYVDPDELRRLRGQLWDRFVDIVNAERPRRKVRTRHFYVLDRNVPVMRDYCIDLTPEQEELLDFLCGYQPFFGLGIEFQEFDADRAVGDVEYLPMRHGDSVELVQE